MPDSDVKPSERLPHELIIGIQVFGAQKPPVKHQINMIPRVSYLSYLFTLEWLPLMPKKQYIVCRTPKEYNSSLGFIYIYRYKYICMYIYLCIYIANGEIFY